MDTINLTTFHNLSYHGTDPIADQFPVFQICHTKQDVSRSTAPARLNDQDDLLAAYTSHV